MKIEGVIMIDVEQEPEGDWTYTAERVDPKDVEDLNRIMSLPYICDDECPYCRDKNER